MILYENIQSKPWNALLQMVSVFYPYNTSAHAGFSEDGRDKIYMPVSLLYSKEALLNSYIYFMIISSFVNSIQKSVQISLTTWQGEWFIFKTTWEAAALKQLEGRNEKSKMEQTGWEMYAGISRGTQDTALAQPARGPGFDRQHWEKKKKKEANGLTDYSKSVRSFSTNFK